MKVALVVERMDPLRGGKETYTAQLAAALAGRGHQVTVVCQTRDWQPEARIDFVEVGRRGVTRAKRLRNFVADVLRHTADGRYDVVHAMLPVPGADLYHPHGGTVPGSNAASLRRYSAAIRPAARWLKGLNAARNEAVRLERQIAEDPRTICICVSEMIAEQFRKHYSRSQGVRVVFNGVEVPDLDEDERAHWRQEMRYRLGVGREDVVFLTVATNFPLKGVAETIVAFARHVHRRREHADARLVVVGREKPEGYTRHAGLRDVGRQVVFLPPTPEVFRVYAGADAFVLLTWYDPCSLTVLEATRWGIPSITTECNGAASVLRDGAGIVIPTPRDVAGAEAAMRTLTDPDDRRRRAEACLAVADRLSMDRHVDELLAIYREVAGRKR